MSRMYLGEYCQHVNPCHSGPGPRCQNGGTCDVKMSLTAGPQFSCSCPIGYSASLCEIEVPNSCESNPCQNGGTAPVFHGSCINTFGSYRCACEQGYTGQHCETLAPELYSLDEMLTFLCLKKHCMIITVLLKDSSHRLTLHVDSEASSCTINYNLSNFKPINFNFGKDNHIYVYVNAAFSSPS
ncbi:Neurogenic locus Notch protein [Nymphon striatum]|nr:Neurogenic locus Notch protein [Nymphon striatum]